MHPNLRLIDLGTSCPCSCIPATTPGCLPAACLLPACRLPAACLSACLPAEGAINSRDKPGYDWRTCIYVSFDLGTSGLPTSTPAEQSLAVLGVGASTQSALQQFNWVPSGVGPLQTRCYPLRVL